MLSGSTWFSLHSFIHLFFVRSAFASSHRKSVIGDNIFSHLCFHLGAVVVFGDFSEHIHFLGVEFLSSFADKDLFLLIGRAHDGLRLILILLLSSHPMLFI